MRPEDAPRACVEGVEAPPIRAGEYGRPHPGRSRSNRRGIHVATRRLAPGQLAAAGSERVDEPVGVARVDTSERHGWLRVEVARAAEAAAGRGPTPDHAAAA